MKSKKNTGGAGSTSPASAGSELDWKTMALDCLHALRLMHAHYNDIAKSNPGFLGKLCLQHYDLCNEALLAESAALRKYADVPKSAGQTPADHKETKHE